LVGFVTGGYNTAGLRLLDFARAPAAAAEPALAPELPTAGAAAAPGCFAAVTLLLRKAV